MASLAETIRRMKANYPTLFGSNDDPTRALHHLFCVGGNGYDWVNGELVSLDYDEEERERLKERRSAFRDRLYRTKAEADEAERQLIEDANRPWGTKNYTGRFDKLYPLHRGSGIGTLETIPDDIKPDWLAGLRAKMRWVLEQPDTELDWNGETSHIVAMVVLNELDQRFGPEENA